MMKTNEIVQEEFNEISEDLKSLDSPMEKIQHVLDIGREFENNESIKQEEFQIQGCVSEAYVAVENYKESGNTIKILYYADALIVQGFLAMLKQGLDDSACDELGKNIEEFNNFSKEVGLEQFLSPNRANALHNIIMKLKEYE